MEKNTIVLDELGKEIGRTYPKRARGLVKNGRAEYVDDCTIRLINAHVPTMIDDSVMEENEMSKVICFNARDFKFDKTCKGNNVGSRMFITDMQGESVEVYEIGDGRSWTQICSEKILEKDTEYVFRFAMTRSCNDPFDGVSQFVIMPIEGAEATDDDWDNRYVYNLAQCQYKPTLSKRWGNTAIRIYEIPFKTDSIEKYRFVFVENHSVTRIFPAKELEAYSEFADYSYNGWFNEKKEQFEKFRSKDFNINVDQTMKDVSETVKSASETVKNAGETVKHAVGKFTKTVLSAANDAMHHDSTSDEEEENVNRYIDFSGQNITGEKFSEIMASVGDGFCVDLSNSNIEDIDHLVDCGGQVDGSSFNVCNSNIGGNAFCLFVQKLGDGCNLDASRANIGRVKSDITFVRSGVDGCNVSIVGANISESALGTLMSVLGDGVNVDLQNSNVDEEVADIDFGPVADGMNINITNASIPEKVLNKLKMKLGDGCNITGV